MDLGLDTLIAHYAEEDKPMGAVVPPIFQNSLFLFESSDELLSSMAKDPAGPPYHYSRVGNPTVQIAEKKIALLEGTEACRLTGSGMAAISVAVMSCVRAGSHVVAVDTCYKPVHKLFAEYLTRFGVTTTFVDGRCTEEVIEAMTPGTSLVYLESPTSLLFRLQDVEPIVAAARARSAATILDNTYSTPLHFRPHDLGVDLVCHSATKYLSGHSDITAGAICGSEERLDKMVRDEIGLYGSILHPFSAWLLLRGLRTLSLRVKRHEETANAVAAWLEDRPEVERVHHLGLPSYPQRDLYLRTMRGSGGLFSFEPKVQDPARVKAFADRLRLFGRGISWGGFESLVVPHPVKALDHAQTRWVVRLFCGLEDPKDLIADLEGAMEEIEC